MWSLTQILSLHYDPLSSGHLSFNIHCIIVNSHCRYQWESRDSSVTRIFFKKNDVTSDPETNHQVLASSLISFSC